MRRTAFHDRIRAERDNLAAEGTALQPEVTNVVEMPAADVLDGVDEKGPMYTLLPKAEKKSVRRKRQRDALVAPASAVNELPPSAVNELVSEEVVATPLRRTPERASTAVRGKVCRSALVDAMMEEDDDAAEVALGDDVLLSKPLGYRHSLALVTLRRRLRAFLAEQADADKYY